MKHTRKFRIVSIIIAAAVLTQTAALGKESIVNSQWSIENKVLSTIDYRLLTSFLRPLAAGEQKYDHEIYVEEVSLGLRYLQFLRFFLGERAEGRRPVMRANIEREQQTQTYSNYKNTLQMLIDKYGAQVFQEALIGLMDEHLTSLHLPRPGDHNLHSDVDVKNLSTDISFFGDMMKMYPTNIGVPGTYGNPVNARVIFGDEQIWQFLWEEHRDVFMALIEHMKQWPIEINIARQDFGRAIIRPIPLIAKHFPRAYQIIGPHLGHPQGSAVITLIDREYMMTNRGQLLDHADSVRYSQLIIQLNHMVNYLGYTAGLLRACDALKIDYYRDIGSPVQKRADEFIRGFDRLEQQHLLSICRDLRHELETRKEGPIKVIMDNIGTQINKLSVEGKMDETGLRSLINSMWVEVEGLITERLHLSLYSYDSAPGAMALSGAASKEAISQIEQGI